jgi:hypothetical protein
MARISSYSELYLYLCILASNWGCRLFLKVFYLENIKIIFKKKIKNLFLI